ncbi:MAG: glycerol-3-phosphate 1-O-acyltransferase PlsY [Candidatus Omnitrophica bacterium]|nr:glycerol-3-phosphate 1-O-acyltransferase PlsY [Candidatus Omnitrophota bacterium]
MREIIFLIFTYLIGSIPFGFVIAYLVKGIDIRKFGSGNIGATNVVRVVGKKWGILVFVLDFLKGFFPLFLAKFVLNPTNSIYIVSAILCICGHNWPIFLKFKGGKGVATSIGAACGLSIIFPNLWFVLLISLCVWLLFFFVFRFVSIASLLLGLSFFVSSLIFPLPKEIRIFALILCLFIFIRHKKNIKNIFAKQEHRF